MRELVLNSIENYASPGRASSLKNLCCRSVSSLPSTSNETSLLPNPFCSGGSFGASSTARLPSASRLPGPGALSGHCRNVVNSCAMLSWSHDYFLASFLFSLPMRQLPYHIYTCPRNILLYYSFPTALLSSLKEINV